MWYLFIWYIVAVAEGLQAGVPYDLEATGFNSLRNRLIVV